jgi:hypothetical protein
MTPFAIQSIFARRVWDSRGRPTVEAEVILNDALRLLPPEDDWSSGNQMIRRILLRQVPLSELNPKALLATDTDDPSAQRGSK